MEANTVRRTTAFEWNAGAWIGSVGGSTLWMLIMGTILVWQGYAEGWPLLAGFALLIGWGVALWLRRETVSAYAAIQLFLVPWTLAVTALVVYTNVNVFGESPAPGQENLTDMPYVMLGLGPALIAGAYFMERNVRKQAAAGSPHQQG